MSAKDILELHGIKRSIYEKGIGQGFAVGEEKELVATFSSQENLDDFLRIRLLKNPIPFEGFEPGRKFKTATDMGEYNDYEIIEVSAVPEIPHDPY